MSRSEAAFTRAVLLRSIAYREADRIVTLLTDSHGKVSAIARGARKSTRRFAGALEPGAILDAEVAIGAGELARLGQARVVRAFPRLIADLPRLSATTAGLEIVREAVGEREPDPRWLPTIERFFERLVEADATESVLHAFALRVLALAGLAPNVESCGKCGREAPPGKAALFDPVLGAIVCRACGGGPIKLDGEARHQIELACSRSWDQSHDPAAPAIARVVDGVLVHHLSRPIHGLDIVAQVREVAAAYTKADE